MSAVVFRGGDLLDPACHDIDRHDEYHRYGAMTLFQLEYIVALEKYRHFRLAAEACHVTQPSLSTQVQKLEEELGVILFDRSARPVTPTPLGHEIVAHARLILGEVAQLQARVQEVTGVMAGELRVGILSTVAPYLIPIVIAGFSRRYPNVTLAFQELLAPEIHDHLRRDLLDVGIVASETTSNDMVDVPLFREPVVAYLSRRHPLLERRTLRPADLPFDELWLLSKGHCFRDLVLDLVDAATVDTDGQSGIKFESGNLETLQRLVDRGHGMTILPWLAVTGEGSHEPQSVREFESPAPSRIIHLVYPRILLKKHLVRAITEEILRAAEPYLPPGSIISPGA
jgi:LysR family transcriptional regulator, hydrogen peroxide-inducible genes activator